MAHSIIFTLVFTGLKIFMRSAPFILFHPSVRSSRSAFFGACCRQLLVCLTALASALTGQAEEFTAVKPSGTSLSTDLYEGMVLGQTVTVAGQDFYQGFVTLWRDKALGEHYSLLIRERPSARTGSVVWIEHRGRRLLQLTLPNSRSMIGRLCEQAVEEISQRLVEAELDAKLSGDKDLARDEL